jgi:hypothetical protein
MSLKYRQQHAHSCNNSARKQARPTIGLLFIIIDSLPHEEIWRTWLESESAIAGGADIHILVHAKFPDKVTSPWVREHLVSTFQYEPKWGSIDIARVMIGLITELLAKVSDVHKLCFLSETCIPVVPFAHFLKVMCQDNNSWVNYYNDTATGYAFQKQVWCHANVCKLELLLILFCLL